MPRSAPWLSTCRRRSKTTIFSRPVPQVGHGLIYSKTGIQRRHVAAPGECSSDLGVAAAEKLFTQYDIDRRTIDFLLFCTQTPDYPLPTTACLMQDRLGCPTAHRGFGLQSGLLRLRLRPVAGRRVDPDRCCPAGAAGYGRDLLEVHRSDRPLVADHLRRRSGGHAGRGLAAAVAGRASCSAPTAAAATC